MYPILIRHCADRVGFWFASHTLNTSFRDQEEQRTKHKEPRSTPTPSQRVGSSSSTLNTRATVPSSLPKSLSATSPALRQTGDPSRPDFATTARRDRASETSVP